MRCTLLFAVVLGVAPLNAQPPKKAPVPPPVTLSAPSKSVSAGDAWIPLPAIPVAAMVMQGATWSADGRYLVAEKGDLGPIDVNDLENAKPVAAIVLWNAATRKTTEIWRGSAGASRVESLEWLGPTPFALAVVAVADPASGPARHLLRIDARRSGAEDLGVLEDAEFPLTSSTSPMAALVTQARAGATVRTLRTTGAPTAPTSLTGVGGAPGWTADGGSLCFGPPEPEPGEQVKPPTAFTTYDLSTGRTGTSTVRPQMGPDRRAPRVSFKLVTQEATLARGKSSEGISPLWMETGPEGAVEAKLISPDADWHAVSPAGDSIAYTSRGALFVAPLLKMDAATVNAARDAARNAVAASNAKQIALAVVMYAMDHDDAWPAGDGDIVATLEPYTKNKDLFKDFHYLPPGGKTGDIESPATKVIGWVPAPAGYAVAFADGHVQIMKELPQN